MSINININKNMGINADRQQESRWNVVTGAQRENAEKGNRTKTFSMSEKAQDPIAQRKAQAFEKARKIVSDAFKGEKKIDAELQELRDLSARLATDNKDKLDQVSQNKAEMAELKGMYGVTEDCQEQKDLEILMKHHDAYYDPSIRLTEQEQERYQEIRKQGPTEYQSRMMERYEESSRLQREMQENLAAIQANGAALRFVRGERLKTSPILDAEDAAEKVLEAESEAITGELVGEAMEHMQKELAEKAEEAEKSAEQNEERKEQIEKVQETVEEQKKQVEEIREETKEIQSTSENISPEEIVQIQEQIRTEIEKILEELKLMAEDLKGNSIDKLI